MINKLYGTVGEELDVCLVEYGVVFCMDLIHIKRAQSLRIFQRSHADAALEVRLVGGIKYALGCYIDLEIIIRNKALLKRGDVFLRIMFDGKEDGITVRNTVEVEQQLVLYNLFVLGSKGRRTEKSHLLKIEEDEANLVSLFRRESSR